MTTIEKGCESIPLTEKVGVTLPSAGQVALLLLLLGVIWGVSFKAPETANQQVNSIGKVLPADAAPLPQQVYRHMYPEPRTLDVSINIYEASGSLTLFDPLLKQNTNQELIPAAAERWTVSADGRTWTFHLRPDARWSDGRPVTAYDFEYTYKRLLNPAVGNPYAFFYYDITGARDYNTGKTTDSNRLGVRATDRLTLTIETIEPRAYFPYITAFHGSSPTPHWAIEKYGKKWTEAGNCVSNGSYRLAEWTRGVRIVLELDPYYNGPNPGYVEKIYWLFSPTTGTVGTLPYENNEVDRLIPVDVVDLVRIEQDPVLSRQLVKIASGTTWYLFFRTQAPPFQDIRVRRAIAHAIDRQGISRVVLRGTGTPAYTMLPPNFPGYLGDKYKALQEYNPALARRLLAEAGYPGGKGFPRTQLWLRAPSAAIRACAGAIQGMLKDELGIELAIVIQDMPTYMDQMYNWNIPMGLAPFGPDFPDPHSNLGMLWHAQPKGYARHDWHNPRFDALVEEAARSMKPDQRLALYDEAQRILSEDVGAAFVYHEIVAELRKPWLKGIPRTKYGTYAFPYLTEIYIGKEILDQ